ncbi:MAG TPA: hypothetical protein VFH73_15155, partial [Polyangia bacterium]|nr:hypothetical protein [Polyangia bacterium]
MECPAPSHRWRASACALANIVVLAVVPALPAVGCVDLTRPSPKISGMQGTGGTIDPGAALDGGFDDDAAAPDAFLDLNPEAPATKDGGADRAADTPMQPHSGLVAYWPVDEGVGNAIEDKTANQNHGQALNGPSWVNRGLPAALVGDKAALRFDGVNDYAVLGVAGIPAN